MKREELLSSQEYWSVKIKLDLFKLLEDYKRDNKFTVEQLAQQMGVTKGYVSQILNGDADHKVSKIVELALMCGKVPVISFEDASRYVKNDKAGYDESRHGKRPAVHINLGDFSVKSIENQSIKEDAVF